MKKCAPFSKDSPPFKLGSALLSRLQLFFLSFPPSTTFYVYPRCERGLNSPFLFSLLSSLHSFSLGVKTTPKLDDGQKQPSSTRKACSFLHPHPSPSFPLHRPRRAYAGETETSLSLSVPGYQFIQPFLGRLSRLFFFANFRRREQSTTDKLLFTSANTFRWLQLSFNINII